MLLPNRSACESPEEEYRMDITRAERVSYEWHSRRSVCLLIYVFGAYGNLCQSRINACRKLQYGGYQCEYYYVVLLSVLRKSGNGIYKFLPPLPRKLIAQFLQIWFTTPTLRARYLMSASVCTCMWYFLEFYQISRKRTAYRAAFFVLFFVLKYILDIFILSFIFKRNEYFFRFLLSFHFRLISVFKNSSFFYLHGVLINVN